MSSLLTDSHIYLLLPLPCIIPTHRLDLTSGVVLDVGHGIVTCAAVWRGEECPDSKSCDPDEATPTSLAEMVHSVIMECSKDADMQKTLIENVAVTGKK